MKLFFPVFLKPPLLLSPENGLLSEFSPEDLRGLSPPKDLLSELSPKFLLGRSLFSLKDLRGLSLPNDLPSPKDLLSELSPKLLLGRSLFSPKDLRGLSPPNDLLSELSPKLLLGRSLLSPKTLSAPLVPALEILGLLPVLLPYSLRPSVLRPKPPFLLFSIYKCVLILLCHPGIMGMSAHAGYFSLNI